MRYRSFLLLLLGLAACAREAQEASSAAARDSSGVRIVDNGAGPEQALAWRIGDEPIVDVGGGGAGQHLHRVASAARHDDGRILVANAGTGEILVFRSNGELLRTVGRAGEGPGEFETLAWAGWYRGDSIAAWDGGSARFTVFDPAGTYARSATANDLTGIFPEFIGVFEDGSLAVTSGMDPRQAANAGARAWRDSVMYVRLAPDATVLGSIGRFPGDEQYSMSEPGGVVVEALPFGRRTVVGVAGSVFHVGSGDAYEVARYSADGRLTRIVRRAHRPARVTERDIAAYRASLVTRGGRSDSDDQRVLDDAPYPSVMPPYVALQVDPDGRLWLREPPTASSDDVHSSWTVFAADGAMLGTVRLPRRLRVSQIGSDWVLAQYSDADHAEHVALYRLHR